MAYVIGMNSGSSFDGIDVVLFDISIGDDGHPSNPKFLKGTSFKWPSEVSEKVLKAFNNELSIFELTRLIYAVGAVYAEAVQKLLKECDLSPKEVEVIGVDGQTIYQEPPDYTRFEEVNSETPLYKYWLNGPYGCGLYIGEPSIIAAYTNITTVSQFRAADQAFGGTGAPVEHYFDFIAFRHMEPVLTLNIGGIANVHLVYKDRKKMMAFDTGPGNVMMDYAAKVLFNKPFDPDGEIAASGVINKTMLDELMHHPFFQRKPPRCAWRLDFGADYAKKMLEKYKDVKKEDIMATLCAFTANSIVKSIEDYVPDINRISMLIANGGGTKNKNLMNLLRKLLPKNIRLTTTDEFGIPSQYKEAMEFGVLAFATIHKLANNIPSCSGASKYNILGKIAFPPRLARLTD